MKEKSQKAIPQVKQTFQVFVRVRPFSHRQSDSQSSIQSITHNTITFKQKQVREQHVFTFDQIFNQESTQLEVYERVGRKVVDCGFEGLNGTIFCYGQTASGKTYTCIGSKFSEEGCAGILPRLIQETLDRIEESPRSLEFRVKISMVQIYNEKIRDLFDHNKQDLKIRSNKKQGVFIENVTQNYVLAKQEAFNLLKIGIYNRSMQATNMNSQSSRSHMLFILHLHSHDNYSGSAKSAKIILVDLAGSEKASKTGAEGRLLQEAKRINTSLTALGKVINSLSDGKSTHIPYRDSKLTRLLQESLGGNCLTNLIINISPSSHNESETFSSIRFGTRAKTIKNEPVINKSYTVPELLELLQKAEKTIKEQYKVIEQLNKKKQRTGGYGALNMPKMITLHLIPDEDEEMCSQFSISEQELQQNKSISLEEESYIDSFSKTCTLISDQQLPEKNPFTMSHPWESKAMLQRRSNKAITMTNFHTDFKKDHEMKKSVCFEDQKRPHDKEKDKENGKESEKHVSLKFIQREHQNLSHSFGLQFAKKKKQVLQPINPNIPLLSLPIEDRVLVSNKQNSFCLDKPTTQRNLSKIRQNLLNLKQIYKQQKEQSSIKSLIFQNKNNNQGEKMRSTSQFNSFLS